MGDAQPGIFGGVPGGILFAEDFDLPDGPAHVLVPDEAEPEVITPSYSAQEVDDARRSGFNAGEHAGRAAAAAARETQIATGLAAIAASLREAAATASQLADIHAEAIAQLLLAGLAGLAPAICAFHGAGEVAAVARIVLPALRTEPRISVTVGAAIADGLLQSLAGLDPDLLARIVIVPGDLPPGDVRIAWRDGEAVRDGAELWRGIAGALTPLGLLPPASGTGPDPATTMAEKTAPEKLETNDAD